MTEEKKGNPQPETKLNWNQIRETILMLKLAISQIERSMIDGDESVSTLASLFTSIMGRVKRVNEEIHKSNVNAVNSEITTNCEEAIEKISSAIVAFQFYDRVCQRLTHVRDSLDSFCHLISDRDKRYRHKEWEKLQDNIKSKYTIGADLLMFEAILKGASVEEALKIGLESDTDTKNGIELF